jgi:long-chain acyl-CoA synthetase
MDVGSPVWATDGTNSMEPTHRSNGPQAGSLVEFIREFARRGDQSAVAGRRGYRMVRWTYGRIAEEAYRFARELETRGISKGDAVLLWADNSAEWMVAFFGCVLRGAIVVPIDRISTPAFVSQVAHEVYAKLLVRSREIPQVVLPVPCLIAETLSPTIARHPASVYDSPPLSRQDPVQVIFTSGTTAEPRGVVITHGNVLANIEPFEREIRKYVKYERLVHPLRFLNLVPLSHIFGQLMGLFIPRLLWGEVIFADSLRPSEVIDTIRREHISVLVAVPRLLESLQREIEIRLDNQAALETFRKTFVSAASQHFLWRWWRFRRIRRRFGWKFWAFISGGAALPAATETFWNRLGYAVIQGYGMTETTSLISLNHPFRSAQGSIGKAFPGMEIRVDANGEILVRGENVASAYRHGHELKPTLGEDGWFHTGDLAEVDATGRLYFKGRLKNVIVTSAGMNIYPQDLEDAIRKQPGVRDCVVIGLERDGNAEPCAVLLLQDSNDGACIVENANKSLAEFQRIGHWFAWPEPDFPRTATQKPQLARIREVAEAKTGRQTTVQPANGNTLTALVAKITGQPISSAFPNDNLETNLSLTSLDRVELMSALEDRYQTNLSEVKFSEVATIGQLERLLKERPPVETEYKYPRWPQHWLMTAVRLAAYYALTWPATYLLAAPRIRGRENLHGLEGPVLVISNHVTYVDIGWILAALPARFRNRLATAMRGERLAEMRQPPATMNLFSSFIERLDYFLALGLFNVFPLPRQSGFLKSFSFAGDLADRGWNILIFPEGMITEDGRMAPFRSGIGLLAKRLNIPVVPMRIDGLFPLKQARRKIARPGQVRVTIGKPARFSADQDSNEIALDLQRLVTEL